MNLFFKYILIVISGVCVIYPCFSQTKGTSKAKLELKSQPNIIYPNEVSTLKKKKLNHNKPQFSEAIKLRSTISQKTNAGKSSKTIEEKIAESLELRLLTDPQFQLKEKRRHFRDHQNHKD